MIRSAMALALCALLTACGTTSVALKYAPPATVTKSIPAAKPVLVGAFTDTRNEAPTWLGAIRGGFGNALKTLESDKPVSELVATAFADGLRARGVTLDQASSNGRLLGVIKQLNCNQLVRREANAEIELRVVGARGETRLTKTFTASRLDGSMMSAGGVLASVEDLRVTLEATLREVVDKALDDSEIRQALQI
jgi:uncharacterized lipoprotein YajG